MQHPESSTLKVFPNGYACAAGIRLIGFKPLACLRTYHQLRNSSFVYPDEAKRPGSATAFIALHDRLLHRDLFALCSFVRSRGAEPRLVALVPQAEEVDPSGYQVPCAPLNPKPQTLNAMS